MSTELHFYDSYINENIDDIIKDLPEITLEEEDEIWKKILEKSSNLPAVEILFHKNDYDPNAKCIRCRNLGARIFKVISSNEDFVSLFFEQIIDMMQTSGYCAQGQTNRYLQIYKLSL